MLRIFLFLLTSSIFAQNNFESIDNFIYDYNKQRFEIWVNDTIYEFDLNKNLIDKYKNQLYSKNDISSIRTIYGHKKELLVKNGSGNIFKNENRIDNSNINSFFTNSISFEHNDTIFKLGGYGYWTKFKGIIFFDKIQKTWESYQLSNIDKNYTGILSPMFSKVEDNQYIIFGGKTFNEKNPLNEKVNREIYHLDMSKKEIVKHGNSKLIFKGIQIYSKNIILNKTELTVLDWKKNEYFKYKNTWSHKVNLNYNIYLINNQFYFIEKRNQSYLLSSFPNEIQNFKISYKGKITDNYISNFIYILLIILILFIVISINKRYDTILIKKNKLSYRFKKISTSKEQNEILFELIRSQKITTNQIHKIINTTELHPNHIYRLIPQIMLDIEKSIKILTNSDQPVFSISKNKMDRRIKEYRLNTYYKIKN